MCNGKEALTCLLCNLQVTASSVHTFEKSLAEELTNELLFLQMYLIKQLKYVHRSFNGGIYYICA